VIKMRVVQKDPISLEQCHLYGVKSTHLLAKKLGMTLSDLERIANTAQYRIFNLKKGNRRVEEPAPALQALHRKIHRYLARVSTPDYLHSTIKGRSYVTNARAHLRQGSMIKIDVKKFYPSVPQRRVMKFFRDYMMCAGDVAGLLAKLICLDGRLPTGSAASPMISYYSFKPMFDEIFALTQSHNLTMTCYVDDLTISGRGANRALLNEVRKIIAGYGLKSHKAKFFQQNSYKEVTGVMLKNGRIDLPFQRWKAIRESIKTLKSAETNDEKLALYPSLISRLHEASQIAPNCRPIALHHNAAWRALRGKVARNPAT
jgi:RNA-directed DNA polymerase